MEEASKQLIYLHGDLDLTIVEARRLPNMDFMVNHLRSCLTCEPCKSPAQTAAKEGDSKIRGHRKIITSDPYVTVCLPQATVARTRVLKNSQNPKWNEHFIIPLAHPVTDLDINVKDNDLFGADAIGTAKIPASRIATGEHIAGWFPLIGPSGKPPKPDSAIYLDMKFTPCENNPLYKQGVASDPEQAGVRHTYFPLRKGSQVTLYQDAHVTDDLLPKIELDDGKVYSPAKCWEDICYAISEAHHLVYIVGWSVFHKVKLVREPTRPLPRGGDLTLGELLKYKSEEGVRVLLLVWDDKTSHDKFGIRTAGVMQTHDEETLKFFKHSSVTCVLAPRYASSKLGYFKQQARFYLFELLSRLLEPCLHIIKNVFLLTLRQLEIIERLLHLLEVGTMAPRQPWHDLHSKIEGPAAYDVLINFEQRWRKSTKWKEFSLLFKGKSHWSDDAMIRIERISWIQSPPLAVTDDGTTIVPDDDPKVHVLSKDDRENWNVQKGNCNVGLISCLPQIFRSIDSGSLKGFPKYIKKAENQNLFCAKNLVIDKSIQAAYIQAIRSAQHYIYIENQYFLGSSYAWPSYKNAGADNLIPMELALKVASKIRAGERFAVYIIIPLWPEGDPKTATVQEILYWQSQTMQMMYDVVAQELKSMQIKDSHPRDYLNFYCLGKREEVSQEMLSGKDSVSDSAKFGRFMIYVHAKGMIVDDEYVIVGSANINQRSMAGTKDTEIAMGAYQPHYTWAKKKYPRGQVHGYRMSLWAEHLGELNKLFKEPESVECVKMVNSIAEENWKKFTDAEYSPLQGHLLMYPLQVDMDGKVNPLPEHENFPDVGGKVIGAHSIQLPDVLTT
ncbi:phospholipase D delta-like [Gossypium australe]|uniref:Phospholipase D n=1 Tax=Gossypium australe TaxID=47621 RepID=A0A5B6UUJ3_9ROSI|nr:phospholipase D delta-like [Gossypium australe]